MTPEQEKKFFDSVGNEIKEGDVIRMFHFVSRNGRNEYMYKRIGSIHPESGMLKVYHIALPLNPRADEFFLAHSKDFHASVVVQRAILNPNENLKRSYQWID